MGEDNKCKGRRALTPTVFPWMSIPSSEESRVKLDMFNTDPDIRRGAAITDHLCTGRQVATSLC